MADVRDVILDQRNWLERLVQRIPGFRGYYGNENRREADRALREFAARRLEAVVSQLHDANKRAPLEQLQERRELITLVEQTRNELRFADQGYAGFFSEIKWDREELLDAVYAKDEEIVESVIALSVTIESGDWTVADLHHELRALSRAVRERRSSILVLSEHGNGPQE